MESPEVGSAVAVTIIFMGLLAFTAAHLNTNNPPKYWPFWMLTGQTFQATAWTFVNYEAWWGFSEVAGNFILGYCMVAYGFFPFLLSDSFFTGHPVETLMSTYTFALIFLMIWVWFIRPSEKR